MVEIAIVIPTFKEVKTLNKLIPRIKAIFDGSFIDSYRIVLVDDTNNFECSIFADKTVLPFPKLRRRKSYGRSLLEGLLIARNILKAETIIQMDADHNPDDIIEFLTLNPDFGDMIIGFETNNTILSRIGSRISNFIMRIDFVQPTCGYRMWKGKVLDSLNWNKIKAKGFDIQVELLWNAQHNGFKVVEMELSPENSEKRKTDKSKMSFRHIILHCFTLFRLSRKNLYRRITNLFH